MRLIRSESSPLELSARRSQECAAWSRGGPRPASESVASRPRHRSRRVSSAIGAIALRLAVGCLAAGHLSIPAAAGWDLSGRYGFEADGLEERFGSGSSLDSALDVIDDPAGDLSGDSSNPSGEIPYSVDALHLDRSLDVRAVMEVRAERAGPRWVRGSVQIRAGRDRSNGTLEGGTGVPLWGGDFSASERASFRTGSAPGADGIDSRLDLAWDRRRLPWGLSIRANTSLENSWAGRREDEALLNYTALRPVIRVARRFGLSSHLSARGGYTRKWRAAGAPGAYGETWAEVAWSGQDLSDRSWELRARSEGRRYEAADSLLPGHFRQVAEANLRTPLWARSFLRLEPRYEFVSYRQASSYYDDYWSLGGKAMLERSLAGVPASLEEDLASPPEWIIGLGLGGELVRHRDPQWADAQSVSLLGSLRRDAGERFWCDVSAEYGRRNYRRAVLRQGFVLEGRELSVGTTDHSFVDLSAIASWKIGAGISLDVFGLLERELHTIEADDFHLRTLTASMTREF